MLRLTKQIERENKQLSKVKMQVQHEHEFNIHKCARERERLHGELYEEQPKERRGRSNSRLFLRRLREKTKKGSKRKQNLCNCRSELY